MTSFQLVSLRTADVVPGGREATTGNTSAVRGLPVGLLAQLRLERCTGIAEVRVRMSITVKKAYKPHAKDSGKEVHVGDGEKGVANSYLGVDLSKHSYTNSWTDMHCLKF